jgi:REP element-mobilizing transposase RayT
MNSPFLHLPSRRALRLKGYDYSRPGFYFLTLCVQNRLNLFGRVTETGLEINDAGKMVERWYFGMDNKCPGICCHEMVVMPNHFHCIIEITPDAHVANVPPTDAHTGAPLCGRLGNVGAGRIPSYGPDNKKYNATIGDMMDWFKTMTTNEYIRGVKNYGWQRFDSKLWQRNYWDVIIHDDAGLARIANYIVTNPENWLNDRLNQ